MKIGNLNQPATTAPVADRKAPATAKPAAGGKASDASATVELSATANLLTQPADGSFDAEKVQRIAQAIRDGKFKVNHEAIADKLIANAQELLGRTGGGH